MIGTTWLDRAYDEYILVVNDAGFGSLDLKLWRYLILDGEKAGDMGEVYDFEFQHARYERVG